MGTARTSTDLVPPRNPLRALLAAVAGGALLAPAVLRAQTVASHMDVWRSPSCGCCKEWIKRVESHGLRVTVHNVSNTVARGRMKAPMKLGSCHTAAVGSYAVEGHVPAAHVLRLVKGAPDAVGLAVPGMPVGSPGMDGPDYGGQRDPFDVLLVAKDGSPRRFRSYR